MSDAPPRHDELSGYTRWRAARFGWISATILGFVLLAAFLRWKAATAAPSLPADFYKVWELLEAERVDEAEKQLEVLMRQPRHGNAYLVLDAALSLHRGDLDAAESRIGATNVAGVLRPFALEVLGRTYYWRNRWYDAERIFATLANEVPRSFAAHLWLGVVYHDLHMFGQAQHELRLASEIRPEDTRPHILQGSILFRYGRFHAAADHYSEALRRLPPDALSKADSINPLMTYFVKCLVQDGRFEEGLEKIAELAEPSVELEILRAECLLGLGQLVEAEQECRKVLDRDENQQSAVVTLVKIGMQKSVTAEHAQLLEAAFARTPQDPDLIFLLAQVHGRLGNQPRQQELLSQSQRLMKLRSRSVDLMEAVWSHPEDVKARQDLAGIFDELGDTVQANQWRQAAAGCQQRIQSIKGKEP